MQHNRYEIEPLTPGARSTHWNSINPAIGALRGRFVLSGDAILSNYAQPDRPLPRLRVDQDGKRQALFGARRDARRGQADLDLGAAADRLVRR